MPESPWNPLHLDCFTCKGFKSVGICSHVLAVNHIQGAIDLVYNLKKFVIDVNKKHKGGNTKKVMPALVREKPEKQGEEVDGIEGPLRDALRMIKEREAEEGREDGGAERAEMVADEEEDEEEEVMDEEEEDNDMEEEDEEEEEEEDN